MSLLLRFWGVRGSIPSPGPETALVGGNTAAVEVCCGPTRLILDAGTGARPLGDAMLRQGIGQATILLSHPHWDHIQGLPFFAPLYADGARLTVCGPAGGGWELAKVLRVQMSVPVFPVPFDDVAARVRTRELDSGERFQVGPVAVQTVALNHPGGALGYRLDYQGRSVVYATDTEHSPSSSAALLDLARGADVFIYDAQYTPDEYAGASGAAKVGWGHSTYAVGAALAEAAGVGSLVLFHHDPSRTDAHVAELEKAAQALFSGAMAAREGLVIELAARSMCAA